MIAKRTYLHFREHNQWELETWHVYVPLDSDTDMMLAQRLTTLKLPPPYAFTIEQHDPAQLGQREEHCRVGYLPSISIKPMRDEYRNRLEALLDATTTGDGMLDYETADDHLYKCHLFH